MTSSPPSNSEDRQAHSSAFDYLHPGLQRWIWEKGWTELHEVQEAAARPILGGDRDVILTAATAGGKTEAAFFPILTRIAGKSRGGPQVLYLSPLKALINDQYDRLLDLCGRVEVSIHRWHGDVGETAKRKALDSKDGILLITPESLEALFVLRGPIVSRFLRELEYIVVDELHAFIGSERGRQLQSLMHRVETIVRRRVPRIAMSATLGDMNLAAEFLRPGAAASVHLIHATGDQRELRLILRGYVQRPPPPPVLGSSGNGPSPSDTPEDETDELTAITDHLFSTLRGTKNLIFANSRGRVENFTDRLRKKCEALRVPSEFWAHHGSLSREYRDEAERALKDRDLPATVVCTSTLELGIDVGQVRSVAQIGAPPSVASLRQRLGRSGRRGEPAILRFYVAESEVSKDPRPEDTLRIELVQSVAMIRLLLAGWCEPPVLGQLHISTLIHQILSLIAERGGATAPRAWEHLCENGAFREVDRSMFVKLLRSMGQTDLITQSGDGTLLLGRQGERLVNHYSFYAVFFTPSEFRLVAGGKTIGSLPVVFPIHEGGFMIFGGRRWSILSIDTRARVIELQPAPSGRAPSFTGTAALVHERVRREMLDTYLSTDEYAFLDTTAKQLLAEGRANFGRLGLKEMSLLQMGKEVIVFCWTGDRIKNTIAAQLVYRGLEATTTSVSINIGKVTVDDVADHLIDMAAKGLVGADLTAFDHASPSTNKYDEYLDDELLAAEIALRDFDAPGAQAYLQALVGAAFRPTAV